MIPKDKVFSVIERLLEKTRAGEVHWLVDTTVKLGERVTTSVRLDPLNRIERPSAFFVRFPESLIRIIHISPPVDSDFIRLDFCKADGQVVDSLPIEDGAQGWLLARELFLEAGRVATGWDEVLEDIDKALESSGEIGLPEAKR